MIAISGLWRVYRIIIVAAAARRSSSLVLFPRARLPRIYIVFSFFAFHVHELALCCVCALVRGAARHHGVSSSSSSYLYPTFRDVVIRMNKCSIEGERERERGEFIY